MSCLLRNFIVHDGFYDIFENDIANANILDHDIFDRKSRLTVTNTHW